MKHHITPLLIALLTIFSCTQNRTLENTAGGDTIPMSHATNLLMVEYPDYTSVEMRNPWDTTKVLHRYLLTSSPTLVHGKEGTIVRIPLQNAAVFTSVHCALVQELGAANSIGGVCDLDYIHLPFVQEGVAEGRIADLGSGIDPSLEHIMELEPDALCVSPFENSGGYGRLEQLGIPIIECADYMETSPLARAEWVRFYGRLFGKAELADSMYEEISRQYRSLTEQVTKAKSHPSLICEIPSSGHWYLPGGESTMGQMYRDAGARYLFADIAGAGSKAMSMELVLDRAQEADVWLIKHHGELIRSQIIQDMPLLSRLNASMWLCDTSRSGFYEETPFHPELLLANLVQIFHPELGVIAEKSYFCPLK